MTLTTGVFANTNDKTKRLPFHETNQSAGRGWIVKISRALSDLKKERKKNI